MVEIGLNVFMVTNQLQSIEIPSRQNQEPVFYGALLYDHEGKYSGTFQNDKNPESLIIYFA